LPEVTPETVLEELLLDDDELDDELPPDSVIQAGKFVESAITSIDFSIQSTSPKENSCEAVPF
jgi:hypothetical protein